VEPALMFALIQLNGVLFRICPYGRLLGHSYLFQCWPVFEPSKMGSVSTSLRDFTMFCVLLSYFLKWESADVLRMQLD
jgi:hypothetical protein